MDREELEQIEILYQLCGSEILALLTTKVYTREHHCMIPIDAGPLPFAKLLRWLGAMQDRIPRSLWIDDISKTPPALPKFTLWPPHDSDNHWLCINNWGTPEEWSTNYDYERAAKWIIEYLRLLVFVTEDLAKYKEKLCRNAHDAKNPSEKHMPATQGTTTRFA